MIRQTILAATAALATFALAQGAAGSDAPNILNATLAEPNQKTPEVSTEELRRTLAEASAIVLDTRSRAEFDAGHIPDAVNLDTPPAGALAAAERLVQGEKARALVLYCNGPYCQASRRLAGELAAAGFTDVRRYQLGIPVWRALGGPTAVELDGLKRIYGADRTAVFVDLRPAADFARGSLAGAHNAPADEIVSGHMKKLPLPEDDFNRRVILFGRDAAEARRVAEVLGRRPWHNVAYYPGSFESLSAALREKLTGQ